MLKEAVDNGMKQLDDIIGDAMPDVDAAYDQFKGQAEQLGNDARQEAEKIANELEQQGKEVYDQAKEMVDDAIDEAKQEIDNLIEEGKQAIDNVKDDLNELKNEAKEEINNLKEQAKEKLDDLKNQAKEKLNELKDEAKDKLNQLKEKTLEKLKEAGKKLIDEGKEKIKEAVEEKGKEILEKGKEKAKEVLNDLKEAAKEKLGNLKAKGKEALKNLADNPSEAVASLGNWSNDITSGLKPKVPDLSALSADKIQAPIMNALSSGPAESDDDFPFYGYVKVGGQKYAVVECTYEFHQTQDSTGKPSSRPRGGNITFKTPSLSDDNVFFYKWMFSKTEVESGFFKFVVYSSNNKRNYKTVSFENAYCVKLQDYFNDKDSKLMYTEVTIAAEIIQVGSNDIAEFNNEWS